MVEFRPDTDDRRTHRRPKTIPPAVGEMLDRTYADTSVCELQWADDDDGAAFLRLCRLYATRRNLRILHEPFEKSGNMYMRIKMRDKRPYRKLSPIWQRA